MVLMKSNFWLQLSYKENSKLVSFRWYEMKESREKFAKRWKIVRH